jgi:hypothetical protein
MADACHLNFGKYTLFSCYSVTANSNMYSVGFAIIFRNENTSNWTKFWEYVLKLHPSMNSGYITIITDHDKGQKNAIARHLQQVGHFHCSWHRCQNIIQMCGGGGKGKTQYSALWMYNKLMRCSTSAKIDSTRNIYVKHMSAKDLQYLNTIEDKAQYPGARCAMEEGIYMYQQSALSAVESMNAANKEMRVCTTVVVLNATLLLIRLECNRFLRMKQEAWGDD